MSYNNKFVVTNIILEDRRDWCKWITYLKTEADTFNAWHMVNPAGETYVQMVRPTYPILGEAARLENQRRGGTYNDQFDRYERMYAQYLVAIQTYNQGNEDNNDDDEEGNNPYDQDDPHNDDHGEGTSQPLGSGADSQSALRRSHRLQGRRVRTLDDSVSGAAPIPRTAPGDSGPTQSTATLLADDPDDDGDGLYEESTESSSQDSGGNLPARIRPHRPKPPVLSLLTEEEAERLDDRMQRRYITELKAYESEQTALRGIHKWCVDHTRQGLWNDTANRVPAPSTVQSIVRALRDDFEPSRMAAEEDASAQIMVLVNKASRANQNPETWLREWRTIVGLVRDLEIPETKEPKVSQLFL